MELDPQQPVLRSLHILVGLNNSETLMLIIHSSAPSQFWSDPQELGESWRNLFVQGKFSSNFVLEIRLFREIVLTISSSNFFSSLQDSK